MGKFPGKPSKIANRKRVNVSKCTTPKEDESLRVAESIYHGLAVFNETFGDEEEEASDFKGFPLEEVQEAAAHAQNRLAETEAECLFNGFEVYLERNFNEEFSKLELNLPPPKRQTSKRKKQCFDGGGDKVGGNRLRSVSERQENRGKVSVSERQKNRGKGSVSERQKNRGKGSEQLSKKLIGNHCVAKNVSLKKSAAKKILQRALKSSCHIPVTNSEGSLPDKSVNGSLRKFVLPSRSAHSSRVIKPNKRFIEVDENKRDVNISQPTCFVQLKKPKLILNPFKSSESEGNSKSFSFGGSLPERVQSEPYSENGSLGELSGSLCERTDAFSPDTFSDGALVVEGKRRWKPSYKVQVKLKELNVFGAGTSRFLFRRNLRSSSDASESVHSTDKETVSQTTSTSGHMTDRSECEREISNLSGDSKEMSDSPLDEPKSHGSKVILRKARLKLNTQTSSPSDGPFSNSVQFGNSSPPKTVECGVCGAVRFYRFVKQARKFGIFSCESCRKFISKMIKRQACAETTNLPPLECHKGGGMCSVPAIVRSQQWKARRGTLARCSYKARCPACWLKKCLRSFKMSDDERSGLVAMLPADMQNGLTNPSKARSHPPPLPVDDGTSSILNRPFKVGFSDLPVVETDRLPKEWLAPVPVLFQQDPFGHNKKEKSRKARPKARKDAAEQSKNKSKRSKQEVENYSKKKKKSGGSKSQRLKLGLLADKPTKKKKKKKGGPVRQKLELKGPRVKHVCRSASIVLGQAPATFPAERAKADSKSKTKAETSKTKGKSGSCCVECKEPESSIAEKATSARENSAADGSGAVVECQAEAGRGSPLAEDAALGNQDENQSYRKLGKSQLPQPPLAHTLPIPGKRQSQEALNQVSIDFWESYDPEEVCNTGFGLIGSEPFHVRAICFLCGSGGLEQLIHCASCCEPYHRFCLEDGQRDSGEQWRLNWICQRCTVCNTCGRGLGQQLGCQRCHKTYHTECLGSSRLHSPDRPWVCPSCLRCKSCGAADVTVFVGNLPLCKSCFKLRQKGNYCPLCQRCYEDHDYDTKMMECAKCSCWVHAKCEGLSDEKYQVLSFLPESVEFVCRMCCLTPPAPWWIAVEEELKAGYLSVLKSLSKNKKTCAMLKSSPKKRCSCRTPLPVSKALDLTDLQEFKPDASQSAEPQEMQQVSSTSMLQEDLNMAKGENEALVKKCKTTQMMQMVLTTTTSSSAECESEQRKTSNKNEPLIKKVECPQMMSVLATGPTSAIEKEREIVEGGNEPLVRSLRSTRVLQTVPATNTVLLVEQVSGDKIAVNDQGEPLGKECSISSLPTASEAREGLETPEKHTDISLHSNEISAFERNLQEMSAKAASSSDPALKHYLEKYNIKECYVRVKDIYPKPTPKAMLPVKVEVPCNDLLQEPGFCEGGKSPNKMLPASLSTPCSDSGISCTDEEVKSCSEVPKEPENRDIAVSKAQPPTADAGEAGYSSGNGEENIISEPEVSSDSCTEKPCSCLDVTRSKPSLTLLAVKKKVGACEYSSLFQFHEEMESLIARSQSNELLETYHHTLREVFPWFDPKFSRVSSRPMHEDHLYSLSPSKMELHDRSFSDENKASNDLEKFDAMADNVANNLKGKDRDYYYSGSKVQDVRVCVLCKGVGDAPATEEGRLLYCGQNEWAHTNCALWSAEVFEEIDGSLQNVHSAVSRGRMIRCPWCSKRGASVGCCSRNCNETYHFPCARKAQCTFMDDKNVYCPMHARDAVGKVLCLDSEFDIRRPIYVELDRKKKKFCEVQKVRFMIGSLVVENLGEFVSGASDHPDLIIPNGFMCSRYFWSSVEPWRVVQYQVKTIVRQEQPEPAEDMGWNVTIDHSEDQEIVQQKLQDLMFWHEELRNGRGRAIINAVQQNSGNEECERKPSNTDLSTETRRIPQKTEEDIAAQQVVSSLLDAICSRDVEDNCLSDPQTTADILPPELKDAIFEDLPHEVLDGISMQDILPKLMSCEETIGIDLKTDGCYGPDNAKDGKEDLPDDILPAEVEAMLNQGLHSADAKEEVPNFVEDFFPSLCTKNSSQKQRELKRSKSEGVSQSVARKITGSSRSQKRSCSLTLSCKLDGSASANPNKRRRSNRTTSRAVQGASVENECTNMLQQRRLPERTLTRSCTAGSTPSSDEGIRDLKLRREDEASSATDRRKTGHPKEEGKENKRHVWHSRSQSRLLQLDGTVDSSSDSEGGRSPKRLDNNDDYNFISEVNQSSSKNLIIEEEPVRCTRCHRTYRTRSSFERHLPTCSSEFILSTSDSDSENTRSSEEGSTKRLSEQEDTLSIPNYVKSEPREESFNEPRQESPKFSSFSDQVKVTHTERTFTSVDLLQSSVNVKSESGFKDLQQRVGTSISNCVDNSKSQEENTAQSMVVSSPASPHPSNTDSEASSHEVSHSDSQTAVKLLPVTGKQPVIASSAKPCAVVAKANLSQGRARVTRQRTKPRATSHRNLLRPVNVQPHNTPNSQYQMHVVHTQAPPTPAVIVQQVASPSVVPAYVEAFRQHTGQSLQYIATIDAHNNGVNRHPYLTSAPNSIVPGTFHLQASHEGFTNVPTSTIPVMPGVQIAPSQPTVLGTIIPQSRPTTLHSVVAGDQVVLGSPPGMEVYTDQSGGMFVASQPMFIGLETIVSNTVMQSQQIVSGPLPGVMAASSSFSATTTQVFQASKIEPIVEVPQGFLLVNPNGQMRNPDVMTCAPPAQVPMSLPSHLTSPQPTMVAHSPQPHVIPSPTVTPTAVPPPLPVVHQPPPAPPPQPPPSALGVLSSNPVSLPAQLPTSFPPPVAASTSRQPPPWRRTGPLNIPFNYVPVSDTNRGQITSQVPQVSTSKFCMQNCNTYIPVSKTVVTVNSVTPPVVTVSSCQPASQMSSLKSAPIVSDTVSSQEYSDCKGVQTTINHPPVLLRPPSPKAEVSEKCNIIVKKITESVETCRLNITATPITPIVNSNKSNNALKLVLQKQQEDGSYKITPNQNVKDLPSSKPLPKPQPINKIASKPKPKEPPVPETLKDQENQLIAVVLQPSQNNVNAPNGVVNGAKHIPNGKLAFLKEINKPKDSSPSITYEIRSQDGFCCSSSSITEVWQKVFEAVQDARRAHKMPPLPQNPFMATQDGLQMLGLRHNGMHYLLEQLPGVGRCIKYKPRYHKPQTLSFDEDIDALPPENKTGSARSQPFSKRSPYDMFSWLASRHRQPPKFMVNADGESMSNRRATSSNLPMAMRFRHLKETSKEAVGVYRSHIHGRGLFCLRDIESGEMVIEYAGEVIRSTLTDKREKFYESKGIGCYMFRIDDQLVVDATMRGNAARFINHSCEPNCYSRVVDILGKKHILIFALRRIPQGEELTYDYKFPFEDVKIPCTCGSRKCRKYLN